MFLVDWDDLTVRIAGFDRFELADAERTIETVTSDYRFTKGIPVVLDLREMHFAPTTETIRHLAGFLSLHCSDDHVFAFVADEELSFGLARMLESYSNLEGIEAGAFRDPVEAGQWARSQGHRRQARERTRRHSGEAEMRVAKE